MEQVLQLLKQDKVFVYTKERQNNRLDINKKYLINSLLQIPTLQRKST